MAAIIRETLVLRGSRKGELNVELRLGTRAKASAVPPALVKLQPLSRERRPDMPGRVADVDYATSGTRHGAGRSHCLRVANRIAAARTPSAAGELWWRGTGR